MQNVNKINKRNEKSVPDLRHGRSFASRLYKTKLNKKRQSDSLTKLKKHKNENRFIGKSDTYWQTSRYYVTAL